MRVQQPLACPGSQSRDVLHFNSSLHAINHVLEGESLIPLAFLKVWVEPIGVLANSWATPKYLLAYLETNHLSCLVLSLLPRDSLYCLVIHQEDSYCDFGRCRIERQLDIPDTVVQTKELNN